MKTPYLIQRMILHKNPPKNPPLDNLYRMDYMGSSEFEWGALPKSLKQFTKNFDKLELVRMKKIVDYKNKMLVLIGLPENAKEYRRFVPDLLEDKIHLKERSELCAAMKGYDPILGYNKPYNEQIYPSAWWDINNHIMMIFGVRYAKILLKSIKIVLEIKKNQEEKDWY